MALENFAVGTLIIPMDTTYQNTGMYLAYGLVYNLLKNGIPVKWAIQQGKAFNATDFTATAQNIVTLAPIIAHNYSGGPFIIDSAYAATALPFITAWQALHPTTVVHRATQPFSADISATMNRAPLIAVEETNYGIVQNYLNLAAIPNSLGNPWGNAATDPDVFDSDEVGAGALFGFDTSACRRIAYDIFLSPHTGDATWQDPVNAAELDDYLRFGGALHAMCHSITSIENIAGPFLTLTGIPTANMNKGDAGTFTVDIPDFPVTQAVSTGLVQQLPGGSEQTWNHSATNYYPTTSVLAHFIETSDGSQYDFMVAGPYKGGTGAGKIVYEGGHNYDPKVPYTSNNENMYYRFFLDSIFFSVTKPLMYLNQSPTTLYQNVVNTITFDIVNTGASPANNATFTVTLAPGVSYNGDASIPPTSIVGQVLTWNLGIVPSGTVVTFTANYTPAVLGMVKLADFSSSFGDNYAESYTIDHCVTGNVEQFIRATLEGVKATVPPGVNYAAVGDQITYKVTITNTEPLPPNGVDAFDVFFKDIPQGASFVAGTVKINNVLFPALDPTVGFYIPNPLNPPGNVIPPQGSVTVEFIVSVETLPSPPQAINQATIDYKFTNGVGTFDSTAVTNQVTTQINQGELSLEKTVNKAYATVGDIVTYTVVVTNTGTVTANNVIFKDNAPTGSTFQAGTFKIGGVPQPGADPAAGVNLGSILPGASVTVSFDVKVNFIPAPPVLDNVANATFVYRINPAGPDLNGTAISNHVLTQLALATLTAVKSANKQFVKVGDTLTYQVVITNTGTVTENNVTFKDTPPAGTTFIPGTFKIGGVPQPGASPIVGVNLGSLAPGASVTVSFDVTVDVLPPPPSQITNTANVTFEYKIDPNGPTLTGNTPSNPVTTDVELPQLTLTKSANKAFVEVGDTLTYTVIIANTGTVTANNVIFKDTPPAGTTFIPGTFKIGVVPQPGADPTVGVNVGNIAPGASVTVSFDVTVNSLPPSGQITNTATSTFEYKIDPQGPTETGTGTSNPITTDVEVASLNLVKTQSKNFVQVGDTLTYTVVVKNTGTVVANNVVFTDTPPAGTTYAAGTFKKNGILVPGADPSVGVNIGSIAPGASVTVTFDVKVNVLPPSGQITNVASATFEFKIDPNGPTQTRTTESNPVTADVETVGLNMVKTVNKSFVQVGDTATYTVVITNTGTVSTDNVIFKDTPPAGTTFIPGTFRINGVPQLGASPVIGVNLGSIPAGGSVTVSFDVSIDSLPPSGQITNTASSTFEYKIDPNGPAKPGTSQSNPVTSEVELAELQVVKSADKAFVKVGDTLTYEFTITNTGTVTANNVTFNDTPPAGTTFIPNTFKLAGVPQPGADPSIGVNLGSLPAGVSVNVSFDVTVDVLPPPPGEITNTASVTFEYKVDPNGPTLTETTPSNPYVAQVEEVKVAAVKTVDKAFAEVGETLTYTVVITNSGSVAANNVVFKDTDPQGTTFVPGSFKINGTPQPGADPNVGINIGTIPAGGSVTVSYNVTVNSVPPSGQIKNTAAVTFEYKVDPNEPAVTETINSNEVITEAKLARLDLVKSASKAFAEVGDTVTYSVVITNTGTVTANNVIFKDTPPAGTTYVPGTFKKNGIPLPGDPSVGINIGSIAPGASVTVSFDVTINSLPPSGKITNTATVTFEYKVDPQGPTKTGTGTSNPVDTKVDVASLSLVKSESKSFVEVGETLTYTVVIKNTGTVTANNVIFKDTPPAETSYIAGTFKKNGIAQPGADPSVGVNIGSIAPGASVTVAFDVKVNTLPLSGQITNGASATFEFKIDPNGPTQTRTADSNTVTADVETSGLTMVKTVDKSFVKVGDTATYTVVITNVGTVNADNVIFKDTPPAGTSFIPGTFKKNGVPQLGANPVTGVNLGTIPAGGNVTVSFDISIDSLPPSGQITNTASSTFQYKVDPNGPYKPGSSLSNPVTSKVELVDIQVVKSADKAFVKVGDTLTYKFTITNAGTVTADNVTFKDTPPAETTFIPNSFKIEGVPQPGADPTAGVNLGSLAPGASVNVSYDVTVDTLPPPPAEITNTASVTFEYKVDPNGPPVTETTPSNPYTAKVEEVKVDMVKTADKAFAEVGETLNYTVVITNSGTVAVNNVIFKDADPQGTTFVPGSFKLNGVPQPAANPNAGVNIGTIPAGGSATVSYNLTVNSVPPSGQIKNTAAATFEYRVDPNGPTETEDINSNEVITKAELGELKPEKSVDKAYVEVGDTLTYTVKITNTGTVTANNVKFTDAPPAGTSFIANSFRINGIPQPGEDPSVGVNIGSIAPGGFVTVSFDVTVDTLPEGSEIINSGDVTFEYKVDPNGPTKTKSTPTNEVTTIAQIVKIDVIKTVNKEYVEVGDTLTYTTTIKNTGTVTATNVMFKDTPPVGTTFVPNSVKVNGVTKSGANPSIGVNVGTITPGNSVIVSYTVTVDMLPVPPELINTASATFDFKLDPNGPTETRTTESEPVKSIVQLVKLDVIKEVDKTAATVGDTINYTVSITNSGTVTANEVVFKDTAPAGTIFVDGSVTVNGVPKPDANPNAGIELGDIPPGGFVVVNFSVKVMYIPDPPQAINVATVDYKVRINPRGPLEDRTTDSNEVTTELEKVELTAIKKVDKSTADIGDILTYTIEITNTGTVTAMDVKFTDDIPEGTEFVPDSLYVDGVLQLGVKPSDTVLLGDIEPGQTVTVTFKVEVIFIPCPPKLVNKALIIFDYQLEVGAEIIEVTTESSEAITYVGLKAFKQLSVDETLTIPSVKPDIEEILEVIAEVEITYTNVIKTPIVISYEGQELTGWKLIVEGMLRQKVVYIADEPSQSVHAAEFDVPFSTFLVLPKDYRICQSIKVQGLIEDVFVKLIDKRTIFKNVTLMIQGKVGC